MNKIYIKFAVTPVISVIEKRVISDGSPKMALDEQALDLYSQIRDGISVASNAFVLPRRTMPSSQGYSLKPFEWTVCAI